VTEKRKAIIIKDNNELVKSKEVEK